jgi:gluconate 2-dehydrogenase gamma chain
MQDDVTGDDTTSMDRRDALKAMAVAAATVTLAEGLTPGVSDAQRATIPGTAAHAATAVVPPTVGPRGTPTDPDLLNAKANWPRLLTAAEMLTLTALCDTIIPADAKSPSASAVGAPAYINEWASSPYDGGERALLMIRGGLAWLNTECERRFTRRYTALTAAERKQVCDDICYLPNAKPEFQFGARFFDQVRDLTASAFYCSDPGMKDIGYVGNVPLAKFDGPPASVLRHVGL